MTQMAKFMVKIKSSTMPARTRTGRTGIVIAAIFPARELLAPRFENASSNCCHGNELARLLIFKSAKLQNYQKALASAGCASLALESSRTCCK